MASSSVTVASVRREKTDHPAIGTKSNQPSTEEIPTALAKVCAIKRLLSICEDTPGYKGPTAEATLQYYNDLPDEDDMDMDDDEDDNEKETSYVRLFYLCHPNGPAGNNFRYLAVDFKTKSNYMKHASNFYREMVQYLCGFLYHSQLLLPKPADQEYTSASDFTNLQLCVYKMNMFLDPNELFRHCTAKRNPGLTKNDGRCTYPDIIADTDPLAAMVHKVSPPSSPPATSTTVAKILSKKTTPTRTKRTGTRENDADTRALSAATVDLPFIKTALYVNDNVAGYKGPSAEDTLAYYKNIFHENDLVWHHHREVPADTTQTESYVRLFYLCEPDIGLGATFRYLAIDFKTKANYLCHARTFFKGVVSFIFNFIHLSQRILPKPEDEEYTSASDFTKLPLPVCAMNMFLGVEELNANNHNFRTYLKETNATSVTYPKPVRVRATPSELVVVKKPANPFSLTAMSKLPDNVAKFTAIRNLLRAAIKLPGYAGPTVDETLDYYENILLAQTKSYVRVFYINDPRWGRTDDFGFVYLAIDFETKYNYEEHARAYFFSGIMKYLGTVCGFEQGLLPKPTDEEYTSDSDFSKLPLRVIKMKMFLSVFELDTYDILSINLKSPEINARITTPGDTF
jgi:hypothetical protein